jgi:hypothetical protein
MGNTHLKFDTGVNTSGVVKVSAWSNAYALYALKLHFADGSESEKYGGSGGEKHDWACPPGSRVTGIKVNGVSIQLTSAGQQSPLFGGTKRALRAGGVAWRGTVEGESIDAPGGQVLTGIKGEYFQDTSIQDAGFPTLFVEPKWGVPAKLITDLDIKMKMVWSCDGRASGKYKLAIKKGITTNNSNSWTSILQAETKTSLSGSLKGITGGFDQTFKRQFESSATASISSTTEVSTTLEVDLNKPCYIYQPEITVKSLAGIFGLLGAECIRGEPA